MDFYSAEDLQVIVRRALMILSMNLDDESVFEVLNVREDSRIALRILRRLRDFIEDEGDDFHVMLISLHLC